MTTPPLARSHLPPRRRSFGAPLPFLVFALPVALLVAATAVFFECAPVLRQPVGNIIFFFLWLFTIPAIGGELLAFAVVERGMAVALQAQGASYAGGIVLGLAGEAEMQTFLWPGFDWTAVVLSRLVYVAVALLLVGLATLPFDRFDPVQSRSSRSSARRFALLFPRRRAALGKGSTVDSPHATPNTTPSILSPVTSAAAPVRLFLTPLTAELKLLLKGQPLLWYVVAAGLILACLLAPLAAVRWLLPLVWL